MLSLPAAPWISRNCEKQNGKLESKARGNIWSYRAQRTTREREQKCMSGRLYLPNCLLSKQTQLSWIPATSGIHALQSVCSRWLSNVHTVPSAYPPCTVFTAPHQKCSPKKQQDLQTLNFASKCSYHVFSFKGNKRVRPTS